MNLSSMIRNAAGRFAGRTGRTGEGRTGGGRTGMGGLTSGRSGTRGTGSAGGAGSISGRIRSFLNRR